MVLGQYPDQKGGEILVEENSIKPKCKTCGMDTSGYKCKMCGAELDKMDPQHACGAENCEPKCEGCGLSESNCTCVMKPVA